jgi:membrane protein YqaA with SNARE-associated domain
MKFFHFFKKENLKEWFVKNGDSKKSVVLLSVISYLEAIFFPIPPDFFLMAILASNNARKWAYYSFITSVFSVLGGITSYMIGFLFFDTLGQKIIDFYDMQAQFDTVSGIFNEHAFWAVFISSFTPLPDKVFNLASGLFKLNIPTFIIAYIIGRSLRFFSVGFLMKVFGVKLARVIYKYLNTVSIVIVLVMVLIGLFIFKF